MKKYVKPDLCYENFQLSRTIANCSPSMNHHETDCFLDSSDLGGNPGDFKIFTEGGAICDVGPGAYEKYCVYQSADGFTIFAS